MRKSLLLLLLLELFIGFSNEAVADVDYEKEIKPLLKTKCWGCHGPLKQESDLRLDTGALARQGGSSGPAVIPNNSSESLLLERITSTEEFERMPPEGEPLTSKQVALFKKWIDQGALSPADELAQLAPSEHWAFQPLRNMDETSELIAKTSRGTNPIDFFIQRKLKEAGIEFAPRAKTQTLLRRLYLDMHGLPPTWEQVQEFEKDSSPASFEQEVESVLMSPRYGERWGQHWLDVVRYADTHGFEVNTPRANAWPYRDYVIESFNHDKPYNQFVKEQLAGDTYNEDAATGFLVAAAVLLPGQIGKDEPSKRLARQDSLDEIIVGTSATFLGLTLGCARCHDHKFDPLTAEDYYSMQAFFAGVDYGDREIRDEKFHQNQKLAKQLKPKMEALEKELMGFEPQASAKDLVLIDDEDLERVTLLKTKNGHGQNPDGKKRGYKYDSGSSDRLPNISQGRYTWWDNHPGEDVFAYHLEVQGTFDLWISWGVHGSGVHTRDARYILDLDGDLSTKDDQTEIAVADQYYFSGQDAGTSEKKPLWSGLKYAGHHQINQSSKLLLRGGDTGTGITADAIVLKRFEQTEDNSKTLPRFRHPVNFERNVERFSMEKTTSIRFTSFATTNNNRYEPCIDELEVYSTKNPSVNLALASAGVVPDSSGNLSNTGRHQLKHINDGELGNNKSWISNEKGTGWVQLNFPNEVELDRIVWGRDRTGKLKDRLPIEYQIQVLDKNGEWKTVSDSSDRLPFGTPFEESTLLLRHASKGDAKRLRQINSELKNLERRHQELSTPQRVYAGTFREPDKTHVLYRGDPEQPQEPIAPSIPDIFGGIELPSEVPENQRRQILADWIASETNPLTARVIVNRIWQYHFGTGIVSTPSDFGLNGARPSHPELLDWLANELLQNNWSLKHIHRLILTSQTWQQSNRILPEAQKVDADCRLLWRFPSRRLEAEAIRDSLLAVTENLNLKMGGPGFNFFKTRGGLNGFPPVIDFKDDGLRRMIYAHKIRMERVPVFGAFDCPDAGQPTPERSRSTTAIQALNLMNSKFIADQSVSLEKKISNDHSLEEQIQTVFRRTLQRNASSKEIETVRPVVEQHGLSTLIRVLFNSNEFIMMP